MNRPRIPNEAPSPAREAARALGLAVLVHVAGLALLWLGSLSWSAREPVRPTPAFVLVDAAPVVERREQESREREAEQRAEQQAEEAQRLLEQRRAEEERRQRDLAEQQQREQEREAAEAERQRLLEQQREAAQRRREEEERRLAELAEQREAERLRQAAEQEAERLRLAREQAQAAERRATLADEYYATLQELITRNWRRPPTTEPGLRCTVRVIQIPGGEIIDQAIVSPCNADELTRRSILAAVERTEQLPYRGYEEVFQREIEFVFRYDG